MQFSQQLAVAVGPEETITKNDSYHNEISGDEAIKRLKVFGEICYLTRHSEFWGCYVLSVCWNDKDLTDEGKFRHYKMTLSGNEVEIQKGKRYESLDKMLEYYKKNRIDPAFPNVGRCITQDDYKKKVAEIKAAEIKAAKIKAKEKEKEEQSSCTII